MNSLYVLVVMSSSLMSMTSELKPPKTSLTTQPVTVVPLPAQTPFDIVPDLRLVYLEYFERGYIEAILGGPDRTFCPNGSDTYLIELRARRDGISAGTEFRRHREIAFAGKGTEFAKPAVPIALVVSKAEERELADLLRLLDRRMPAIPFNGTDLVDVFDYLREVSGASIYIDWASLEKAQVSQAIKITLKLKDHTFAEGLNTILATASPKDVKLKWFIDDGVITISTADSDLTKKALKR